MSLACPQLGPHYRRPVALWLQTLCGPTYRRCDYRSASSPLLKEQSSNLASVSPPKPACYSENARACARARVWGRVSGGRSEREKRVRVGERESKKEGGGVITEWPFPSLSDTTPLFSSKAMQK